MRCMCPCPGGYLRGIWNITGQGVYGEGTFLDTENNGILDFLWPKKEWSLDVFQPKKVRFFYPKINGECLDIFEPTYYTVLTLFMKKCPEQKSWGKFYIAYSSQILIQQ